MLLIKLVLPIRYSDKKIIFRKIELIFLPPKLTLKIENIQFLTGLTIFQKILVGGSFRYKNLQQIRQTYRTKY